MALLEARFGDYGLIGVVIAEKQVPCWKIIELAFSCGAMGKQVENACLNHLAQTATEAQDLFIHFIKTARNEQMYRILTEVCFRPADDTADAEEVNLFRPLTPEVVVYPAWFKISLV